MLPAGHEDSVEAAGFSRHLPLAATGSIDGKLIIWDCGTFTERGVCQHDDVSGGSKRLQLVLHTWQHVLRGSCECEGCIPPMTTPMSPGQLQNTASCSWDRHRCLAVLCAGRHSCCMGCKRAARSHRVCGWRGTLVGPAHSCMRQAAAWPQSSSAGPDAQPRWQHAAVWC